jgi:hypothetical protein
MPRPGWTGRKVTTAIAWTVNRDAGICGICDHTEANSLDHIVPVAERPDLEWDPDNWRACHLNPAGQPKGCTHPGCHCPGNVGRGVIPLQVIRDIVLAANARAVPTRSREW